MCSYLQRHPHCYLYVSDSSTKVKEEEPLKLHTIHGGVTHFNTFLSNIFFNSNYCMLQRAKIHLLKTKVDLSGAQLYTDRIYLSQ